MRKKGFVIANLAEEYLVSYSVTDGSISRSWGIFPEFAHIFKTIKEADEAVIKLESSYQLFVLGIKETETQIGVFPPRPGRYPEWLIRDLH